MDGGGEAEGSVGSVGSVVRVPAALIREPPPLRESSSRRPIGRWPAAHTGPALKHIHTHTHTLDSVCVASQCREKKRERERIVKNRILDLKDPARDMWRHPQGTTECCCVLTAAEPPSSGLQGEQLFDDC